MSDNYADIVDKAIADAKAEATPEDWEKYGDAWTKAALDVAGGNSDNA